MYVACSTLCYGRETLSEAIRRIRELGFQKVELAVRTHGPHTGPREMLADLGRFANLLRSANICLAAIYLELTDDDFAQATHILHGIGRLARHLAVPIISVPAAPRGSDFAAEVERLQDWSKIATVEGVILAVETHGETITADPMGAVELCQRIPGLGITLDPSHYLVGPHRPESLDILYPMVTHVRLRDTGSEPGQFQVRIGQGIVEYGRIIAQLQRHRYQRVLCVDIRDVPTAAFPVEPEVRKLKYLLESLV